MQLRFHVKLIGKCCAVSRQHVIKDACIVDASQHVVVTSPLVHNLLVNLEKKIYLSMHTTKSMSSEYSAPINLSNTGILD